MPDLSHIIEINVNNVLYEYYAIQALKYICELYNF